MRRWTRRQRERAAQSVMRHAFLEIRYLAKSSLGEEGAAATLDRIGCLADACHNMPGAGRPLRPGDPDPFIGPWKSATPGQHAWLAGIYDSLGLDTAWLDSAPLSPPVVQPAEHPRLRRGGIRFPRGLREYASLDTGTLQTLVADAHQHTARPKSEPGVALRHVDPSGRHLLRAVRPGELLFRPERDDGLAEYRCLMQMDDGAIVNGRLHLRPAAVTAQPSGLPLTRRLWLAASVPQRNERDMYLWNRDHQHATPDCRLCATTEVVKAPGQDNQIT